MAVYVITRTRGGVGASKEIQPDFSIAEAANGRNRLECAAVSVDGSDRWELDDEIGLTEDGVTIFGGILDVPVESGVGGFTGSAAISQRLSFVDFNVYPSRITVGTDTDRPSETLRARLAWIAGLMSAQGVSATVYVNGSTVTAGPMLVAASYSADRYLLDVLNETMALASGTGATSWVWEVDYTKVLRAIEAGTSAAPFNLADGDGQVLGDIVVESSRPSDYANYVILLGGQGTHDASDSFTGDGVTSSFTLTYTLSATYGYVTVNGVQETLAVQGTGFDSAVYWLYYASDNTIRRVPGAGPPAAGAAISITYVGQFPVRVLADGGVAAANRVQRVYQEPEVFDKAVMQALADSYLTRDMQSPKVVRFSCAYEKTGLHPGQTLTITSPKRNLSGTFLITDVRIAHVAGSLVQRHVVAVGTTRLPRTLRERFRQAFAGRTGAASASSVTVVTGGTFLSSPVFLGGSDRTFVAKNPSAWVRVPNATPYVAPANLSVTLRAMVAARTAGVTVAVRLYDATSLAVAFASAPKAIAVAGEPEEVTASGSLTSGHKYFLEMLSGTNGEGVAALGHLESA
ncbi:MAG TPA: hypothetical protein VM364_08075 [Vicinamibacterales bacterium]|nr:hypothetical protein [Vicinamibacterales bacterium]